MRANSRLFRLSLLLASSSLSISAISTPLLAQQAAQQAGDPPALAGQVAKITGTVSFHVAGDTQWSPATLNYPVTNGDAFWTEPQATAELDVADDRLVLAGSTELDIAALDEQALTLTAAQGAIFVELHSLPDGQTITVNTPRGGVQITSIGQYEIVAGDTNDATTVSVVSGAAHISGTGVELDVGANQTASIGGTDSFSGTVGPLQQDDFLTAQIRAEAPREVPNAPRQVRYMTGGSQLAAYGNWSQSSDYGSVWYPNDVASDWVPYRDGRWSYVAPWGWTWVDNAAWGFAPFHYGRWVQVGPRWGWVAVDRDAEFDDRPVYAPALVSFVGYGGDALAGAAFGFAAGAFLGGEGGVGWIPLGPREPYYPPYRVSDGYLRNVNRVNVVNYRNITINNRTVINHYENARGATVVPARDMVGGRSMRDVARPLPEAALGRGRAINGRAPVAPTAQTPNLAPTVARRYNIKPQAAQRGPAAPGPQVVAHQAGGRAATRPALRPASLPSNVRATPAAQIARPNNGGVRPNTVMRVPGNGLPALRAPGATPTAPNAAAGNPNRPALTGRPSAPGPQGSPRANNGMPALRSPGAPRPMPGSTAPTPAETRTPGVPRNSALAPRPANTASPRLPPANTPRNSPTPNAPRPAPQVRTPAAPRPEPALHHAAPRPVAPAYHAPAAPAYHAPAAPAYRAPAYHQPAAPRVEAPRMQAPMPRVQAPRPAPQPRMEAPRVAPPPRMEAPHMAPPPRPAPPAPRPAPPPPHQDKKPK